jgi:hypothetical protein
MILYLVAVFLLVGIVILFSAKLLRQSGSSPILGPSDCEECGVEKATYRITVTCSWVHVEDKACQCVLDYLKHHTKITFKIAGMQHHPEGSNWDCTKSQAKFLSHVCERCHKKFSAPDNNWVVTTTSF